MLRYVLQLTKRFCIILIFSSMYFWGCAPDRNNPYDSNGSSYVPLSAPAPLMDTLKQDSVYLSWIDNNTHEAGYMVFAGTDTASMQCVDTLDSNTVLYSQPFANPDTIFFCIAVFDNKGQILRSAPVRVAIIAKPEGNAGPDQVVNFSQTVFLSGTAAGSPIEMAWKIGPDGQFESTSNGERTFTAPAAVYADYPCVFRVKNSDGKIAYDTLSLTIGKEWEQVGTSPGVVSDIYSSILYDMTISSDGTPYIALFGLTDSLRCMRFSDADWEQVGPNIGNPFAPARIEFIGNQPFVIYINTPGLNLVSAYFYQVNSKWQMYPFPDAPAIADGEPVNSDICQYNDIPYIAYIDTASKISVKKFDHGIWDYIGEKGFFINANYKTVRIVTDSIGRPYVCGATLDGEVMCYAYNSINWTLVGGGSPGITGDFYYPSIAVSNDTCLISFTLPDTNGNLAIYVKESINGSPWTNVNSINASGGREADIKIINGIPYIAFRDSKNNSRISVLRYVNGQWRYVGNQFISPAWYTKSIRLETNGNQLYVAGVYNVDPMNVAVWRLR